MRLLLGADWLTVGILAVIALAEGARRIPDGALILRALGLSDWLVLEGRDGRSGLRFVSWWPPFTRHVVLLPATEGISRSRREITERLQLVDRRLGALESLGALQVVTLVLGVPILSARFSATGFIASIVAVVVLTACCAIVAYRGFRKLGMTGGEAWRATAPLISPFAASQCSERLREAAVRGASPIAAARALMEDDAFLPWVRPLVYDMERGLGDPHGLREILSDDELRRALGRETGEGMICPRCGREFKAGMVRCSECEDVELVRSGSPTASASSPGTSAP